MTIDQATCRGLLQACPIDTRPAIAIEGTRIGVSVPVPLTAHQAQLLAVELVRAATRLRIEAAQAELEAAKG